MTKLFSKCQICGNKPPIFSKFLGICPECIKNHPTQAVEFSRFSHKNSRETWDLRPNVPSDQEGLQCHICSNNCCIKEGETGYCGIRENENGHLRSVAGKNQALLHTYLDPLPTNCCSTYFCPEGTSTGYNLASFLYGCNFSCLGCQNDQNRTLKSAERYTLDNFVSKVQNNSKISCICWFGGSPEPQLPWALRASRRSVEATSERLLRICWEWNGAGSSKLVKNAVSLSLKTGGNAKFDLKYFSPILSKVLSGVSNEQSFKNFENCYHEFYQERKDPVLSATTLLVPAYVDKTEVGTIAQFLANLDKSIPYSLLVFHPDSFLMDLPITPKQQVKECYQAAKNQLNNVHIGNKHLLGWAI
ncbi:MAG: 4Fe-4S cluster-binding domain-containing protein [Candidatus Hodarchaeales archaeon]|jgi:pyruvate formate lyase activating enzyme